MFHDIPANSQIVDVLKEGMQCGNKIINLLNAIPDLGSDMRAVNLRKQLSLLHFLLKVSMILLRHCGRARLQQRDGECVNTAQKLGVILQYVVPGPVDQFEIA